MAGLSSTQMRASLMSKKMGFIQGIGVAIMTLVFCMELFAVVVITQQLFQTYRLMTASSNGFDFAKSYYLSPRVTMYRHAAVKGFFFSLPLFILAMACKVWAHLRQDFVLACVLCSMLALASLLIVFVYQDHRNVFLEKFATMEKHNEPLLTHMSEVTTVHRAGLSNV